ncbi:hypothetical protein ONS96_008920 [Cadophora gregata f. sp. sojae]|nr:hypothetical protein ONS96_008920 [Cadophora gregata f. sp. sojae]
MIYLSSDVFALCHDGQIPPFYQVALCDDFLYDEAKAAYKEINFQLTLANEAMFNKMNAHKVQYLRHLYFQWDDLSVQVASSSAFLCANKNIADMKITAEMMNTSSAFFK